MNSNITTSLVKAIPDWNQLVILQDGYMLKRKV